MISLEQKMLDHSASMILLVDTDGLQIVRANRQAGQVLGYTVDELLSHKIVDIESSLQDVFYWEEVEAGAFTEIEWQEGLYCGADGELIEVDPEVVRAQRKHEERRAKTADDLVALGRARGYRNPEKWATYVEEGRKRAAERYRSARWGT